MKLADAIAFWVTESGYRQIQDMLSKHTHGTTKYALSNLLEPDSNTRMVNDAIDTLRSAMETASRTETYYRGSTSSITNTHRREGFFSVAYSPDKASTYGTVYTVRVQPDVPRLKMTAEGGEVLLHDGMVYTYSGQTITVSTPKAASRHTPFLGNLYMRQKTVRNLDAKRQLERVLAHLWCYLQVVPDTDGIYVEDCTDAQRDAFARLPLSEQYTAVVDGIRDYAYKDELFAEVAGLLRMTPKQIQNMVGGTRQTRRRRRHRLAKLDH